MIFIQKHPFPSLPFRIFFLFWFWFWFCLPRLFHTARCLLDTISLRHALPLPLPFSLPLPLVLFLLLFNVSIPFHFLFLSYTLYFAPPTESFKRDTPGPRTGRNDDPTIETHRGQKACTRQEVKGHNEKRKEVRMNENKIKKERKEKKKSERERAQRRGTGQGNKERSEKSSWPTCSNLFQKKRQNIITKTVNQKRKKKEKAKRKVLEDHSLDVDMLSIIARQRLLPTQD